MVYFILRLGKGFIAMVYYQKLENNYFSIANVYSIIMEIQILLDTQVELSIRRMIYELWEESVLDIWNWS